MFALQAAIGSVNDIADADRDLAKPGKPIPAGLVSAGQAAVVAIGAIVVGLVLAVPSGLPTVAIALLGLAIGLLYDLRLKGTAWSWLPFAIGVPLLPVFAWIGATGELPRTFVILVPAAFAAGTALAIANAVADVDRDRASGVGSVAVALGRRVAWRLHAVLLLIVFGVALGSLTLGQRAGPGALALAAVAAGGLLVAAGGGMSLSEGAERRERGWELEAVGIGVAALGWIAGVDGLT